MSESRPEDGTGGRRRVCTKYVDSGGHCRFDCNDLHPSNIREHTKIRGVQLRKDVLDAPVYVCATGDRCRKFKWGICPHSHASDARDVRAGSSNREELQMEDFDDGFELVTRRRKVSSSHNKASSSNTARERARAGGGIRAARDASQLKVEPAARTRFCAPLVCHTVPKFDPITYQQYLDVPEVLAAWIHAPNQRLINDTDLRALHGLKRSILGRAIRNAYLGWPLIFFAVQSNRPRIFAYLLECGTNTNIFTPTGIPLLAFVILCPQTTCRELMVEVLLDFGANAKLVPTNSVMDGGAKRDNAPGWMKRLSGCMAIYAAFEAKISPRIKAELRKTRRSRREVPGLWGGDSTATTLLREPSVASERESTRSEETSHRSEAIDESISSSPTIATAPGLSTPSLQGTLISRAVPDTPATTYEEGVDYTGMDGSHRETHGRASVVLLSISNSVPRTALGVLSQSLGAGLPLILPARMLCNQYPELRMGFQPGEDPHRMRWPIDDFIRQTEGRRGMILIDGIDQGLDSNSAAYKLLCQWWERGEYRSKFGSTHDIRNIIWVITCPRYPGSPPISVLKNSPRGSALNPVWPLLAYELAWPPTITGVEMAGLLRALANDAANVKPVINRLPPPFLPQNTPLPDSPQLEPSSLAYDVAATYPMEHLSRMPSLQEDLEHRSSVDSAIVAEEEIVTPPLINLLDEPLDEVEADALPPPMSALCLNDGTFVKTLAETEEE